MSPVPETLWLDLPGGVVEISVDAGAIDDPARGTDLADLVDELRGLWAALLCSGAVSGGESTRLVLTSQGHGEIGETTLEVDGGPGSAYAVSGAITRIVIGALIGHRLLLHSGAVALEGIGTVLLIGPSGAGKSTATSVLGQAGGYLTDELAILDPKTFALTGYPKPVSRVDPQAPGRLKRDHAPADLGLHPIESAPAPAMVVLLERQRDETALSEAPAENSLARVPLDAAILRIIEQSSSLWRLPDPMGTLARLLETAGGAVEARYREAERLHVLLSQAPEPVTEPWEIQDGEEMTPPEAGQVAAAPFVQALHTEAAVLVLREGSIARLDGIGALSWDLLVTHSPMSPGQLTEALIAEIGPHPESANLVEETVEALLTTGTIRR